VVFVIGVVVAALAIALWAGMGLPGVMPAVSGSPAATGPNKLQWSDPLSLADMGHEYPVVLDSGIKDIVIVSVASNDGYEVHPSVAAVDTRTMTRLWSKTDVSLWNGAQAVGLVVPVGINSKGVMLALGSRQAGGWYEGYELVDPATGTQMWQSTSEVVAFGDGFFVSRNAADGLLCASTVASPGVCLWQVPGPESRRGYGYLVTGLGSWLQTPAGVLDMATGAPAPFGADARASDNGDSIFYAGPSGDRMLRIAYRAHASGTVTIQIWDPATDAPVGQPITRKFYSQEPVLANPDGPVLLAGMGSTVAAYSWSDGNQQWQVANPYPVPATQSSGEIVGDKLLWGELDGVSVAALEAATGRTVWSSETLSLMPPSTYGAMPSAVGNVCYLQDGTSVYAVDFGDFTTTGTAELPRGVNTKAGQQLSFLGVAGGHVVAFTPGSQLYVLQ